MKRLLLSFLVLSLAIGSVNAQSHKNHQKQGQAKKMDLNKMNERAETMKNQLFNELDLTSSQRTKGDQQFVQLKSDFLALHNSSGSKNEKKQKAMSLASSHQSQFKSMLTAEQNQKFDALVNNMKNKNLQNGKRAQGTNQNFQGANNQLLNLAGNTDLLTSLLGSNLLNSLLSGKINIGTVAGILSGLRQ
jgi:hypothetical protein